MRRPAFFSVLGPAVILALLGPASALSSDSRATPARLASAVKPIAVSAAVEACIEDFREPRAVFSRLEAAGWELTPFAGSETEFEVSAPAAPAGGFVAETAPGQIFCRFGELGSLEAARSMVDAIVERRFGVIAQRGRMEGAAGPCDGWVLFPGRGTITVSYDGLGNDPVCPDPAGANIVIRGSS
ncbi:MAG: hypothetical protein AAF568_10525 [Pseudomonadota bacterium]